jgi:hypothetical protein
MNYQIGRVNFFVDFSDWGLPFKFSRFHDIVWDFSFLCFGIQYWVYREGK